MSNVKISNLPYVPANDYTLGDYFVIVNFTSPSGTTSNTTLSEITSWVLSNTDPLYLSVNGGILYGGLTADTISATTYLNLPQDVYVTGGTYSNGTIQFTNNTGGTFNVVGLISANTFTTGFTFNPSNYDISIQRNDGVTLTQNLGILSSDLTITGGTYNPSNGVGTFTNNTGGTFSVTGFLTGYTDLYVTGGTFDKNTGTLTLQRTDGPITPITGFTDEYITGGTFSGTTLILDRQFNSPIQITGFTSNTTITGFSYNDNFLTIGLLNDVPNTVEITGFTGTTLFQTISATTISGGTFYGDGSNLIGVSSVTVTGVSYDNNFITVSNSNSTSFSTEITGFTGTTIFDTISATTISGGTFYGDGSNLTGVSSVTVTGVSYNNNFITISNSNSTEYSTEITGFTGTTIFDTISATTYQNLPQDIYVTGGTIYTSPTNNNISGTTKLLYSDQTVDSNNYTIPFTDKFITGMTFNLGTYDLSIQRNDGVSFTESLSILGSDLLVTGGTYNPNNGVVTLTNNSGATFNISGFTTGYTDFYVTGGTLDTNTGTLTLFRTDGPIPGITGFGQSVTGISYNNNYITLGLINGSSLSTQITGFTGTTTFNTISATTYQNLPLDVYVTGGTFDKNTGTLTLSTNSGNIPGITGFTDEYITGGTFSGTTLILNRQFNTPIQITGFTSNSSVTGFSYNNNFLTIGLSNDTPKTTQITGFTGTTTFNTISATTYQNLPTDIRVTGASYSNNTFTYTNNTGGTFSTLFNTVTGLTVNGNITITGNTVGKAFSGTSAYFSGSGQNILTVIGSGNSTTSPLFTVQGSSGELFSITDTLVGSLFSVNDISGLPVLEVFSDNRILQGSFTAPSLNTTTKLTLTAGTNSVYSIPTSAYTGAFFDYTLISTGSTGARAGNLMTIWSGSTTQLLETKTSDIGTTTGVTFSMAVSGNNAVLSSSATTTGWILKTIVRSI